MYVSLSLSFKPFYSGMIVFDTLKSSTTPNKINSNNSQKLKIPVKFRFKINVVMVVM